MNDPDAIAARAVAQQLEAEVGPGLGDLGRGDTGHPGIPVCAAAVRRPGGSGQAGRSLYLPQEIGSKPPDTNKEAPGNRAPRGLGAIGPGPTNRRARNQIR